MRTPTPELLRIVAEWAAEMYPGLPLEKICIHFKGISDPFCIPIWGVTPRPNGKPDDQPARGQGISPVTLDILTVLEEAGKPLTTTRILEAMAKRRPPMEWSARSVSEYLARMMEDGTLVNPEGAKPPGYRLPG